MSKLISVAFSVAVAIALAGVCVLGMLVAWPAPVEAKRDSGGEGQYDQYGGWTKLKGRKTGFFHIEKIKGQFWFVTPEGNAFFSKGVCSVNTKGAKDDAKKPEGPESWAETAADRLRGWGFNTGGCWTTGSVGKHGIVWTPFPDLGTTRSQKLPDVNDPKWVKTVKERAIKECGPHKDDPWVLGYFTDNEIDWHGDEGKARQYFKVVSEAIREADPNHLILGCRFAIMPSMSVVREMKGCADVISMNNYDRNPPVNQLKKMHEETGLPVMVTEFSCKAKDSGPLTGAGAGPVVETQKDRARQFERYVGALVDLDYCVGYQWFKYRDNPGSNQGLVNRKEEPWTTLTEAIRDMNRTIEARHRK